MGNRKVTPQAKGRFGVKIKSPEEIDKKIKQLEDLDKSYSRFEDGKDSTRRKIIQGQIEILKWVRADYDEDFF